MNARTRLLALNTDAAVIPSCAATSSPGRFSDAVNRNASHVRGSTRAHTVTHAWLTNEVGKLFVQERQELVLRLHGGERCQPAIVAPAAARPPLSFGKEVRKRVLGHQPQPAAKRPGGVVHERPQGPGQPHHHVLCHILGVGTLQASLAAPAVDLRPIISDERFPGRLVARILADAPRGTSWSFPRVDAP